MLTIFRNTLLIYSLALFLFILPGVVTADSIELENGDRLTGTVIKMENGIITLKTDYSEPVKIQQSKIRRIITDAPVEIRLSSGESLKGKLHEADGRTAVEATAERESVVIDWKSVASINPPPLKWQGNVTVGASLQSGNSDRLSISLGAEAVRRSGKDRYSLRAYYNYAEDNKEVTTRNAYGALKYDYFFTKSFYSFLSVEFLNDTFKDLNLRVIVGPGVGYQIWESDLKSLLVEAGVSFFSEDLDEGRDDQWVTGRFASQLKWKIFDKIVLSDYFVIYPSFRKAGEYQLRNEAGVSSALSTNWALKLTNILEHDSDPPEDIKKTDTHWILGLQYVF